MYCFASVSGKDSRRKFTPKDVCLCFSLRVSIDASATSTSKCGVCYARCECQCQWQARQTLDLHVLSPARFLLRSSLFLGTTAEGALQEFFLQSKGKKMVVAANNFFPSKKKTNAHTLLSLYIINHHHTHTHAILFNIAPTPKQPTTKQPTLVQTYTQSNNVHHNKPPQTNSQPTSPAHIDHQ